MDPSLLPAAGVVAAIVALPLTLVLRAQKAANHTYQSASAFDAARLKQLEDQVDALSLKVANLETAVSDQRRRAHDWRSFAASLMMERQVIRRLVAQRGYTEVIELMDELDAVRDADLVGEVRDVMKGRD